jgi:glycosyltransferase involved in cell wall biosynthesis/GT2 family glycosyltransferase
MRLCTIVTKDHLPWARVLVASWTEHHPGQRAAVLVVDEPEDCFRPEDEHFDVLRAEDVAGSELPRMALRYTPFELAMALKPLLLSHELDSHEQVVYLDADILVTAELTPVAAALAAHEIVLTPHLLDPIAPDEESPDEPQVRKGGTYNAGFVAVRRGDASGRFLAWWGERLRTACRVDVAAGIFVDQSWLDFVPAMFGGVALLDDRGCNVAYWNLAQRPLELRGDVLHAGGARLRFMHFSGLDPDDRSRLSRYGTRSDVAGDELLSALVDDYASKLEAAGERGARTWPYSWSSTGGGIALTPQLRRLLDAAGGPADSIFTVPGERAWLQWLNAPAKIGGDLGITRLLAGLHAARPDLRDRFPDLRRDAAGYLRWFAAHGRRELDLPPALTDGPRAAEIAGGGALHDVGPGDDLGLSRGQAVVCIPLYGAHDLFVRCLGSILAHTPRGVPILVADDAGPDPASRAFAEQIAASGALRHRLLWLRHAGNHGFVENVNAAFALCAPADVVVINSDCVVAAGWLEGMYDAVYDDTNVATATALTNHGTIVSVPARNQPRPDLAQDLDFLASARRIRAGSLRLRPRIPTCVGHCFYVRRDALELVGPFDPAFSPAYGEEVDFAQRCVVHGLVHVVADDVLVLHRQGGSLSDDGEVNPIQDEHEQMIGARYPFYQRLQHAAGQDQHSTLARALDAARRALGDLSVTIDGRSLGPYLTGTQLHVLELILALDRTQAVRVRVVVPPDLGGYAREALASAASVTTIGQDEAGADGVERTSIVHRPQQVADVADLRLLTRLGARSVITQQDLIAYRNPGYFPGYPQFARYRLLTRQALALADMVVFFSHHAARDAVLEELVEPERARVAYIGVDHRAMPLSSERRAPEGSEALGEREVLLCLGTDFRHKNRLFALRVVEQLQLRHGWEGRLVLAGPRVQNGSSAGDEASFLATRPRVMDAVVSLPAISEAEKAWLYERSAALLYPTLYEGFGLMPFEAADHGIPALWAPQASLPEVLPQDAATLVAWDPAASADATIEVLRHSGRADALLAAVRGAAERYRWDATGRALVGIYGELTQRPVREARHLAAANGMLEAQRAELERKYAEVVAGFTDDGRRLVGSGGLLSTEQQRVLRAALERKAPLTALGGALQAVGRLRGPGRALPAPGTDTHELHLHWDWLNRLHLDEELADIDPHVLAPDPS